jgi:hypothetical protein
MTNLYLFKTNCNSLSNNWEILARLKAKEAHGKNTHFAQLGILCRQYSLLEYQPQSLPPLQDSHRHIGEILSPLKSYYLQDHKQDVKQEQQDIDLDLGRWNGIVGRLEVIKRNKKHHGIESPAEEIRALCDALSFLLDVLKQLSEKKAETNC